MTRSGWLVLFFLAVATGFVSDLPARAGQARYLFKVASLAPDGSIWARRFRDFAEEVRSGSSGAVDFKIYPGGVMGDDRAMYRKLRVGQLQGGGFTMTGIGRVVPDFRVLGVPFMFSSYEEVDSVRKALWPSFRRAFADKGLELLAITEVGFIYTMSSFPIAGLADLKRAKCWVPEGDPVSQAYLRTLGVTPIQLSIPDVLASLQTGLIDTVFNSFYGSVVLQWFTRTKYVSDVPFGYAYGAFVLDRKKFSRLPAEYAALMRRAARVHFARLLQDTRRSNAEAREVLRKNGVRLVAVGAGEREELRRQRRQAVERLIGRAFSREIYQAAVDALRTFRDSGGGRGARAGEGAAAR